jgi:hypothetical protein
MDRPFRLATFESTASSAPSRGAAGAERSEHALDGRERREMMFDAGSLQAKSSRTDLNGRVRLPSLKCALSFHDD